MNQQYSDTGTNRLQASWHKIQNGNKTIMITQPLNYTPSIPDFVL